MKMQKLLKGLTTGASLAAFVAIGGIANASDLLSSERLNNGYQQMGDEKKPDAKGKDKKSEKHCKGEKGKDGKEAHCGGDEKGKGEGACGGEGGCGGKK